MRPSISFQFYSNFFKFSYDYVHSLIFFKTNHESSIFDVQQFKYVFISSKCADLFRERFQTAYISPPSTLSNFYNFLSTCELRLSLMFAFATRSKNWLNSNSLGTDVLTASKTSVSRQLQLRGLNMKNEQTLFFYREPNNSPMSMD